MESEDILQQCLAEIASGRKTVKKCLAAFPREPELSAQLRLAEALRMRPRPTLSLAADLRIEGKLRRAVLPAPPQPVTPDRQVITWEIQSLLVAYVLALMLVESAIRIFNQP